MKTWLSLCLGGLLCLACSGDKDRGSASYGSGSGGADSPDGGAHGGSGGGQDGSGGTNGPPNLTPTSTDFQVDATGEAGLDAQTIDDLRHGGSSCTTKLLYPYEGTVFPGGLLPPPLMWEGAADAAYVKLTYDKLDNVKYEYAVKASNPGELRIPKKDWYEITRRTQGTALLVTLSVKTGASISTCKTRWGIAMGNMVGSLYYNTYNHPDTNGLGAVLRLVLGRESAEVYLKYGGPGVPLTGPCTSCHSVSFDGSTMVASTHDYLLKSFPVSSHEITSAVQPAAVGMLDGATFGALTRDGSRLLAMGNPQCTAGADTFPRAKNNFPLVEGSGVAALLDTKSGKSLAAKGLDPDFYMWMPQFSPNGDRVVFNHAKPDGKGGTDRRELAMMDFDASTSTFSNLRVLVSHLGPEPSIRYAPAGANGGPIPSGRNGCGGGGVSIPGLPGDVGAIDLGTCTGPCYPAWPFFTPDGRGVVFSMINEPDFASALPGRDKPAQSELWYVDTKTGEKVRLDRANAGLKDGDKLVNYYPTVLPVQVGGYFWVFWTSTRDFGHRDLGGLGAAAGAVPAGLPGVSQSYTEAIRKRIWVAALRPQASKGEFADVALTDLSYPPFYLEGQSDTGNVRAFATLNACVPAGTECTSGLDCCTGFCDLAPGAAKGTCGEDVGECAELNERCKTDDDCCPAKGDEAARSCIGGYCGFINVL